MPHRERREAPALPAQAQSLQGVSTILKPQAIAVASTDWDRRSSLRILPQWQGSANLLLGAALFLVKITEAVSLR